MCQKAVLVSSSRNLRVGQRAQLNESTRISLSLTNNLPSIISYHVSGAIKNDAITIFQNVALEGTTKPLRRVLLLLQLFGREATNGPAGLRAGEGQSVVTGFRC